MRYRVLKFGLAAVALVAVAAAATMAQTTSGVPRTKDGKPNFTGIWQVMNTANWDIQTHSARMGPVVALGAAFSIPAGVGVVDGEEIPYTPAALKQKQENQANWLTRDPEIKCYMPGIPRATYMPYPFQIVQSQNNVLMAYEFASASRVIRMNSQEKSPAPSWMGWGLGRWDGDTLVVDVTDHMEETWFDRAGNFHSDALKVTERYTLADANTINYEATIEDPKTFTKPWKMRMPIYRHREPNAQLMEYKCVEFAEELMYGHLRKQPTAK
jgi:hypothetical protein